MFGMAGKKLYQDTLTLGRTGVGGWMPPLPIRLSQIFEKTIYSKRLKLSLAVHTSSAEILICQLRVYHFLTLPWQPQISIRFG